MLNNIKIMFIDIDGTLAHDDGSFSEYTKEILKKAASINKIPVLCSGRSNSDIIAKSKSSNAGPIVISSNGSLIFDYEKNKKIYESSIDFEALKSIWDLSRDTDINITCNSTYTRFKSIHSKKDGIVVSDLNKINDNITQIVIDTKSEQSIEKIKKIVNTYNNLEIKNFINQILNDPKVFEEGFELDIANKESNKGNAINQLLKYLNLTKENAICFGDRMNDSEMFEMCGISVAMENASKDLKRKASYVTLSNNNDGVAKFIEKCIL